MPACGLQIVKMMIVVVVVFAVSWLPFQAFVLVHSVLNSAAALSPRTAFLLTLAFYWLAMSTSASNPLIYFYMNRRYTTVQRRTVQCNVLYSQLPALYSILSSTLADMKEPKLWLPPVPESKLKASSNFTKCGHSKGSSPGFSFEANTFS